MFRKPPPDAYLAAIERYYRIICEKTRDLIDPTGRFTWHGTHRMPEHLHYLAPEDDLEEEKTENAERD